MGEGNEAMSKEEMAIAIEECVCQARAETENPCMTEVQHTSLALA
jgi:hypothetical protein